MNSQAPLAQGGLAVRDLVSKATYWPAPNEKPRGQTFPNEKKEKAQSYLTWKDRAFCSSVVTWEEFLRGFIPSSPHKEAGHFPEKKSAKPSAVQNYCLGFSLGASFGVSLGASFGVFGVSLGASLGAGVAGVTTTGWQGVAVPQGAA
jgi:hypothetical protein